jgi:hypothetical protein
VFLFLFPQRPLPMPTTVDEAALAILFKTSPQLAVVLHKQAVVANIRNRIERAGKKESYEVLTRQVASGGASHELTRVLLADSWPRSQARVGEDRWHRQAVG